MLAGKVLSAVVVVVVLLFTGANSEAAGGLGLRLNARCLDYINSVCARLMRHELTRNQIGAFSSVAAGGRLHMRAGRVSGVEQVHSEYRLQPSDTVHWHMYADELLFASSWSYAYDKLFVPIKLTGRARLTLYSLKLTLTARLAKTPDGKLKFERTSCSLTTGHFHADLYGPTVLRPVFWLLRGLIADRVKPQITSAVCASALRIVDTYMNGKLAQYPLSMPLAQTTFALNNTIVDGYPVVGRDNVDTLHNGAVRASADNTTAVDQLDMPPLAAYNSTEKMINIVASDYLLQSLFTSAHASNASVLYFTSANASQYPFMRRACPTDDICIGVLLPEIWDKYGEEADPVLILRTLDAPPQVQLMADQSTVNGSVELMLVLATPDLVVDTPLLHLQLSLNADLQLWLVKTEDPQTLSIGARLQTTASSSTLLQDTLHDSADAASLSVLIQYLIEMGEQQVNGRLALGVPLPWIRDVDFVYPKLDIRDRTAVISSDVSYAK